jgi:hypothetical protein
MSDSSPYRRGLARIAAMTANSQYFFDVLNNAPLCFC